MLSFQLGENLLGRNLHVKVLRTRNKESFIVGYFLGDIHVYSSTLSLHSHERLLGEALCAATATLCVQSPVQDMGPTRRTHRGTHSI